MLYLKRIYYEKNSGLDTEQVAAQVTQYNPGNEWVRAKENL